MIRLLGNLLIIFCMAGLACWTVWATIIAMTNEMGML